MCGIAAFFGVSGHADKLKQIEAMTDSISLRGPDDRGVLYFHLQAEKVVASEALNTHAFAALAHRRLSILDLSSAGHQPMSYANARYWITYNGEIYNYLELRQELTALGHQLHSHSDTEVILAAYAQWGEACLHRFQGMWSFIIIDTQQQIAFASRDFFGIKPLYYTYYQDGLAFASEIKALLKLPGIRRQVNPQRLYNYLRSGQTDGGSETMFAEIRQLPSAHFLKVSLDKPQQIQIERYWQLEKQYSDITWKEATDHLRHLFLENVNLHLRSDVPVGAALSGGIDSSAIVMAMRRLQRDNLQLHTFSYIASDLNLSEEKWVDIVAKAAKVIPHKIQPSAEELVQDLDELINLQDEPFSSTSMYAQYRVFQLAKAFGIKVMLDGQGADEILGGYRPYIAARIASLLRQGQWQNAKNLLQKAAKLPGSNQKSMLFRALALLLPPDLQASVRQLIKKDLMPKWMNANWFAQHGVFPKVNQRLYGKEILRDELHDALFENSLPMLLRYEDRNSMAHSIESRVPFLTPSLVNFIFSLPEEFIISNDGTSKAIFRQAMRGIVPDVILDRKDKIGFATPEQSWLTTLRPWVETVLNSEMASQIPALNLQQVKEEWKAVIEGRAHFDFRIWRWVNLIRWAENFAVTFED